jgi:hypothetical protein
MPSVDINADSNPFSQLELPEQQHHHHHYHQQQPKSTSTENYLRSASSKFIA